MNISGLEFSIKENWEKYNTVEKYSKEKTALRKKVVENLLKIISLNFQSCSPGFYCFLRNNEKEINERIQYDYRGLHPFLLAETYLREKSNSSIENLENYLKEVQKRDFDAAGIKILRSELADGVIVRNVYRSGDETLIDLFSKYLPKPNIDLFKRDGGVIPKNIEQKHEDAERTVKRLAMNSDLQTLEKAAITLQRHFRRYKRRKQEIKRVGILELKRKREESMDDVVQNHEESMKDAKKMIQEGEKPYLPRCRDRSLANRIFLAASKVPPMDTIRHLTASHNFAQIFDNCLFGRQALSNRYIPYRPASLWPCDQDNGDSNVICFGPQLIDQKSMKSDTLEITLDMKKLWKIRAERANPCIFFKQQDLGFTISGGRRRTVTVGDTTISFDHTLRIRLHPKGKQAAKMRFGSGEGYSSFSLVANQHLVSSNSQLMTMIQTLNFFRYLDGLYENDEMIKKSLYKEIRELDDEKLVEFLTNLHREITDTAEFNFYGAYQINPELVRSFTYFPNNDESGSTKIELSELIDRLNKKDFSLLQEVKDKMPFLLKSERFRDFLLGKVQDPKLLEKECVA